MVTMFSPCKGAAQTAFLPFMGNTSIEGIATAFPWGSRLCRAVVFVSQAFTLLGGGGHWYIVSSEKKIKF